MPSASVPSNNPSSTRVYSPSNSPSTQSVQGNGRGTAYQSPVENRNWNRFPSASGTTSQSQGSNQVNRYSRPEMSQPPVRQYVPAPVRPYEPAYQQPQRPPLQMSKPIVTERAPRGYENSGYRASQAERQAPAPRSYENSGYRGGQVERQAPPQSQRGGGSSSSAPTRSSGHREGKR